MGEVIFHHIPNNKNLSHFFKMCYVLRDIRHISGTTECAQLFYSDATEFPVAVKVLIFALLGGCHLSRSIQMDSQG